MVMSSTEMEIDLSFSMFFKRRPWVLIQGESQKLSPHQASTPEILHVGHLLLIAYLLYEGEICSGDI
ncbi:unnamed protein product [Microthlaspi erraticum]|uniref:Uncharacterized protein n=1 Tax=Microthlaspi erraticum TaxID=1685480 RepID=A0A6D2L8V5_9BRAS|nr:unnamed protein product [Microthlaspi erraticum]